MCLHRKLHAYGSKIYKYLWCGDLRMIAWQFHIAPFQRPGDQWIGKCLSIGLWVQWYIVRSLQTGRPQVIFCMKEEMCANTNTWIKNGFLQIFNSNTLIWVDAPQNPREVHLQSCRSPNLRKIIQIHSPTGPSGNGMSTGSISQDRIDYPCSNKHNQTWRNQRQKKMQTLEQSIGPPQSQNPIMFKSTELFVTPLPPHQVLGSNETSANMTSWNGFFGTKGPGRWKKS